ncbi:MAG TPA: right-handed parallel beta-helix repeat-containing protein [Alphaproteobacteria bacterium]|nr:right-handed parallel beta-helix repeat-containing protein [Alphaproteobacteria bacterium]
MTTISKTLSRLGAATLAAGLILSGPALAAPQPVYEKVDPASVAPQAPKLPDISGYTVEAVRERMPKTSRKSAKVELVAMEKDEYLQKFVEGEQGDALAEAQRGEDEVEAIVIREGTISLKQLVDEVDTKARIKRDDETVWLSRPLLIGPGATLVVNGRETERVRLGPGAPIINAGTLYIVDAKVTSWDSKTKKPIRDADEYRPFIAARSGSETYIAGSDIGHLGFDQSKSYGLSFVSGPDDVAKDAKPPRGWIVGNTIHNLHYGFYSYEAEDVAIVGNTWRDNIVYGIDPHDRSRRLIIAKNLVEGTQEKHGIVTSREVTDSFIFANETRKNAGSGIVLDRQSNRNVIADNVVAANTGDGIALFESSQNMLWGNRIEGNANDGIRVRNSVEVTVAKNTIAGNKGDAFELATDPLSDQDRDTKLDPFEERAVVAFGGNTLSGNGESAIDAGPFTELTLWSFQAEGTPIQIFAGELEEIAQQLLGLLVADDDGAVKVRLQEG